MTSNASEVWLNASKEREKHVIQMDHTFCCRWLTVN